MNRRNQEKKYVYVLKLNYRKWYVGITSNPYSRINYHFSGRGGEVTKRYKPLQIVEIRPNCEDWHERYVTLEYIRTYGFDNVYGYIWCSLGHRKKPMELNCKWYCGVCSIYVDNLEDWEYHNDLHELNWKCLKCYNWGHNFSDCKKLTAFVSKHKRY